MTGTLECGPKSQDTSFQLEKGQIDSLNQFIGTIATLTTSSNKNQVDLSLIYLPRLLERLNPFTESIHPDLQKSYSLFMGIIFSSAHFNPDQKSLFVQTINEHDLTVYSAFSEQISTDPYFQTEEWLQRHAFKLLGLNPEETKIIILQNWENVKEYLNELKASQSELTLDILREISGRATNTILPSFAQGFRHDPTPISLKHLDPILKEIKYRYKFFTAHGAPADKLNSIMSGIINKANHLIQEPSKKRFEKNIALLAADYASAHPHPDGNGTKTLFFIEACMALRKDYPLLSEYETDMNRRTQQFLRGNLSATAILVCKNSANIIKSSITAR